MSRRRSFGSPPANSPFASMSAPAREISGDTSAPFSGAQAPGTASRPRATAAVRITRPRRARGNQRRTAGPITPRAAVRRGRRRSTTQALAWSGGAVTAPKVEAERRLCEVPRARTPAGRSPRRPGRLPRAAPVSDPVRREHRAQSRGHRHLPAPRLRARAGAEGQRPSPRRPREAPRRGPGRLQVHPHRRGVGVRPRTSGAAEPRLPARQQKLAPFRARALWCPETGGTPELSPVEGGWPPRRASKRSSR